MTNPIPKAEPGKSTLSVFSPEFYFPEDEAVQSAGRRSVWLIVLTVLLVLAFFGVVYLFWQQASLDKQVDDLSEQFSSAKVNLNNRLDGINDQLSSLENQVAGLHPAEQVWQINGRIQTLDTLSPFTGALMMVEIKGEAEDGWQVVAVKPSGEYAITFVHPLTRLWVRVQLANLPEGWEAQLDGSSGRWTAVSANTFEAQFNSVAEAGAEGLVVNVGVTRTFEGAVQLGSAPGFLPPNTSISLHERDQNGDWREVASQVMGPEGRFNFSYPSAVDNPAYRLQANFGPEYETVLASQSEWEVDEEGLMTTRPQLSNNVNMAYEVTAVTLAAESFQPIDERWIANISSEDSSTIYYTVPITDGLQAVQSHLYLPPGAYQMAVWTPIEAAVDAAVRYIVEVENGISEGAEICPAFISMQQERVAGNQSWWDVTADDNVGQFLRVQSFGGQVTVTVRPAESAAASTLMGLGPIRFIIVQPELNQPIVPCQ